MIKTKASGADEEHRREAHRFLALLKSGDATEQDAADLQAWRTQDPSHELAFRDAVQLWKSLGPAMGRQKERHTGITRRGVLVGGALAASAAGTGIVGSALGYLPSMAAFAADYTTGVGEQASFEIQGGIIAELDAGSVLDVDVSDRRTNANLSAGAAVFSVRAGAAPFSLMAGSGIISTAAGVFSVSLASETVDVACEAGIAMVNCNGIHHLMPGQMLSYSTAGAAEPTNTGAEAVAAWRRGLLVFSDRPLADVIADINRHRTGRVILARRAFKNRRVSGVFHLSRTDEIIAHLSDSLGLSAGFLPGGVVVLH